MELRANNIDNGRLLNLINDAIAEVAADISARGDIKTKRQVVVKIDVVNKENYVEVGYSADVKLPPNAPRKAVAFVDGGKLVTEVEKKSGLSVVDGKSSAAGEK